MMKTRLEREIEMMVKLTDSVYASRDTKQINDFLQGQYKEFRRFWLEKVGEDEFAETWNRINSELRNSR